MIAEGLVGAAAALTTSALWAGSTTVLTGAIHRFGPRAMNLFRVSVATMLFWLAVIATDPAATLHALTRSEGLLLVASGVVGLAFGDFFLFAAIRLVGAQPAVAMNQLSPIWAAILGAALGTESLGAHELLGIAFVVGGVLLVLFGKDASPGSAPLRLGAGLGLGLLSSLSNALAGMLAHRAFHAGDAPSILSGATLRMTGAAVGLWCATALSQRLVVDSVPLRSVLTLRRELTAVFFATFVGIFLQQVAYASMPASLALSILSTTPLFLMPLAIRYLGERYRWTAWLGTVLATLGIPLLLV